MIRDAWLSRCGKYRWTLTRTWGDGPAAWWVMLNPSTADALVDDPTIRRCVGFSQREGCGSLVVVNLFSLRTTRPVHLTEHENPIGSETPRLLRQAADHARAGGLTVAAWGAHAITRWLSIGTLAQFSDGASWCLGKTKGGHPRHPLYVRADRPLEPWRW